MPRGRPRKLANEQTEITAAVHALGIARGSADAATADATEAGNNKFIQAQAKQLLERVEADRAAAATDEPSGVEVGLDWNFLKHDPTDFTERFERKGIKVRKDHRYRWINKDPRRFESRLNKGWLPVEGGSFTNGDSVLASMPESLGKKYDRMREERLKMQNNAHMQRLEAEGAKLGMEVFTGNKSLRDGLE